MKIPGKDIVHESAVLGVCGLSRIEVNLPLSGVFFLSKGLSSHSPSAKYWREAYCSIYIVTSFSKRKEWA